MARTTAALILATQQFEEHPAYDDPDVDVFLVIEAARRFDAMPYHRHKIVLLVSALRHTVARLRDEGRTVHHVSLSDDLGFAEALRRLVDEHGIERLAWMSATDRGVDSRIGRVCDGLGLHTKRYPDELFLTPAAEADSWFA
jgi:deoxyribodipyrimidine photolyase-related protein